MNHEIMIRNRKKEATKKFWNYLKQGQTKR